MYAKEIGRKYAQSQFEVQMLEQEIKVYDEMLVRQRINPLPSYISQGLDPIKFAVDSS